MSSGRGDLRTAADRVEVLAHIDQRALDELHAADRQARVEHPLLLGDNIAHAVIDQKDRIALVLEAHLRALRGEHSGH